MTNFIRISLSFANGTIGIMSFVTDDGVIEREPSAENINETIEKSNFESPVVSWRIIQASEIPASREFRGAWIDDGQIKHDIEKVKLIHIDHIREARAYLLADLDIEFTKAQGKPDSVKAAEVEAERERLRKLPTLLSIAMATVKTIEEVKSFTVDYRA